MLQAVLVLPLAVLCEQDLKPLSNDGLVHFTESAL